MPLNMSTSTFLHLIALALGTVAGTTALWLVNALWKARLRGLGIDQKKQP